MNMKATFKGVPGEDHQSVHMYGQDFPLGKAVEINSVQGRNKLANHPHFEVSGAPDDPVEDAKIKREFAGATEAALDPIAEAKAAEDESVRQAAERERLEAQKQGRQPRR
jgi:hypothetical protein